MSCLLQQGSNVAPTRGVYKGSMDQHNSRSRCLPERSHARILSLLARCLCLSCRRKGLQTRSEGNRGGRHSNVLEERSPTEERTSRCSPVVLLGGVERKGHEICSFWKGILTGDTFTLSCATAPSAA